MKQLLIGANYYPEDWDDDEILREIPKMKENGFNVVRIGEFAWAKDEPQEGQYDFAWLHRVVDLLGEAGIRVIMGTPTATPPQWLLKKYPDAAQTDANGLRVSHGGRRHCCSSNPHYKAYSYKITEKLAREFGKDKNIIGWQIDNEIYPGNPGCCCPYCVENFHAYLRETYQTVENMNAAWNLNLFSQHYDSFEDVPVPIHAWHNPHIKQAWLEAQGRNHIAFVHEQAEILHRYTQAPVGTDTMPFNALDYRVMENPLDVAQFNHYHTKDNLAEAAMWMDYLRKFSKQPFWNTETDPCWNGAASQNFRIQPENFIYAKMWLCMALGGEGLLFWLWRTHWAGHELMHGGVYESCGRPTYANGEIRKAIAAMEKAEDFLTGTRVQSEVALHMSALNWKMLESQELCRFLGKHGEEVQKFYNAMLASGIHPDVIDAFEALDSYKLIVSPLAFTLEEGGLKERITAWVKNGGVWIAGPLTDIRTNIGTKYKTSPYGFLEKLTGAHQCYQIPPADNGVAWEVQNTAGKVVKGDRSFELFDDDCGTPLLTVTKGHSAFVGKACAKAYPVGKGTVILLGTFLEKEDFGDLLRYAASLAAIKPMEVTGGAFVTKRCGKAGEGEIVMALNGTPCVYRFAGKKKDILTDTLFENEICLQAYEVAVLQNV